MSKIYRKSVTTISNWIEKYETDGNLGRKKDIAVMYKKFGHTQRKWLVELYRKQPILYLREAQEKFFKKFNQTISAFSISLILHQAGFTWKVIERRAIQIKINDVLRFCQEMDMIDWSWENLVFLDEVSFNGSDLLRKKGYGAQGQSLVYRGEFTRTKRISLLCFIGVNGLINSFETEGTFTRKKFVHFCRQLALESDEVKTYPGQYSIWVLDGAKIHCSDKFVYYLRSLGIIPVFLPAYCPMMNPIEIIFGIAKVRLRKMYVENAKIDKSALLCEVMNGFTKMYMGPIFNHCGYLANGTFDPSKSLKLNINEYGFS